MHKLNPRTAALLSAFGWAVGYLLAGKALAAVTTCGYRPEKGADLFLEAMARWCKHGQLRWLGGLTERHLGYDTIFMDEEKAARARAFAAEIMKEMQP
mgnify:CR=1 FL=1